jgi:hypothetical protein
MSRYDTVMTERGVDSDRTPGSTVCLESIANLHIRLQIVISVINQILF